MGRGRTALAPSISSTRRRSKPSLGAIDSQIEFSVHLGGPLALRLFFGRCLARHEPRLDRQSPGPFSIEIRLLFRKSFNDQREVDAVSLPVMRIQQHASTNHEIELHKQAAGIKILGSLFFP